MLARGEGHLPVALPETLPPIQFDDAREAEVACARSPTPRGITPIFGCGSRRSRRFVEMVEMRVREQHQIQSAAGPGFSGRNA